jgi:putative transposase
MRALVPRRRPPLSAGLVFHICNRSAKRTRLFLEPSDYAAFERVLIDGLCRFPVALLAYCVMPNHWHLVVRPDTDDALRRFMHWVTMTHARRWQNWRDSTGQGAVYQGRFRAIPVNQDTHFQWVCRYVERNPLRANLVERAEDWEWSSLRRRYDAPSWLALWPVPRPDDWIAMVNLPQTDAELASMRTAMRTGQPLGNDDWCRVVRTHLGISEPKQRGRSRSVLKK